MFWFRSIHLNDTFEQFGVDTEVVMLGKSCISKSVLESPKKNLIENLGMILEFYDGEAPKS